MEAMKLSPAILVQTVSGGVAYGCPLGASECKFTAVPLDGGAARQLGVLQGFNVGSASWGLWSIETGSPPAMNLGACSRGARRRRP